MNWDKIAQVEDYIIDFLSVREILELHHNPASKNYKNMIEKKIHFIKFNSSVYQMFFKQNVFDNRNIRHRVDAMYIIPFPVEKKFNEIFKNDKYRNFKQFIFYQIHKVKQQNSYREFFLMSRLDKLYYVKEINDNLLIMIFVSKEEQNVYYTFFEKRIMMHSNDEVYIHNLPQNGYIIKNGVKDEIVCNNIVNIICR